MRLGAVGAQGLMKSAASRLLSCYLFRFIAVDLFSLFFYALDGKTAQHILIMLNEMAIKVTWDFAVKML